MWVFGAGMAAECVKSAIDAEAFQGFCVDEPMAGGLRGSRVVNLTDVLALESAPKIFVATGYRGLNSARSDALARIESEGASLISVVQSHEETLEYGLNCFVMSGSVLHPHVRLGRNVFVWGGATVCHHVAIGNDVWITAGATIAGGTSIGNNVFIGANATIVSGINVGSNVFIGAGALVTSDVPDDVAIASPPTARLQVSASDFVAYLEQKGSF